MLTLPSTLSVEIPGGQIEGLGPTKKDTDKESTRKDMQKRYKQKESKEEIEREKLRQVEISERRK